MTQTPGAAPLIVPLVGAAFRPPAKQLLAALPRGTSLRLQPEPQNPYDAKAIQVWGRPQDAKADRLNEAELLGAGWTIDELLAGHEVQLGYIGDSDGKVCAKLGSAGNREVGEAAAKFGWEGLRASLDWSADGTPACVIGPVTSEGGNTNG